MKKRILFILPQPFFTTRGSSFRALSTVEAIAAAGYDVDLLCYCQGTEVVKPGISIKRIPHFGCNSFVTVGPSFTKALLDIPLFIQAALLCVTRKYQVIHGVEEAGFMAAVLGTLFRKPYIFDMHSWMSQQLQDGNFLRSPGLLQLFKKLEVLSMRHASAIVTVGAQMTRELESLAPGVLACTLNDLPLELPESTNSELIDTIKHQFVKEADYTLLYTGNFHIYQGIDLLLRSVKELKQGPLSTHSFKLLLVGGGAGEEEKQQLKYKKMAIELGVQDEVVFCGGYPLECMSAFYACADVLISPRTTGNNVPLKIYTYMASGKLIVATNIESHTQILNSDNAILAAPDPALFAQAIFSALAEVSDNEACRLISNAKKSSSRKQEWGKFELLVKSCYDIVISKAMKSSRAIRTIV